MAAGLGRDHRPAGPPADRRHRGRRVHGPARPGRRPARDQVPARRRRDHGRRQRRDPPDPAVGRRPRARRRRPPAARGRLRGRRRHLPRPRHDRAVALPAAARSRAAGQPRSSRPPRRSRRSRPAAGRCRSATCSAPEFYARPRSCSAPTASTPRPPATPARPRPCCPASRPRSAYWPDGAARPSSPRPRGGERRRRHRERGRPGRRRRRHRGVAGRRSTAPSAARAAAGPCCCAAGAPRSRRPTCRARRTRRRARGRPDGVRAGHRTQARPARGRVTGKRAHCGRGHRQRRTKRSYRLVNIAGCGEAAVDLEEEPRARGSHRLHRPLADRARVQGLAQGHPARRPARPDRPRRAGQGAGPRPDDDRRHLRGCRRQLRRARHEHRPRRRHHARPRRRARHVGQPVLRLAACRRRGWRSTRSRPARATSSSRPASSASRATWACRTASAR